MIISLSGRLRSGKGEMASICEKNGFKRLYFAIPLKQLCAKLLNISIDELNNLKNNCKPIDIICSKELVYTVANETKIPYDFIEEKLLDKKLDTVRDMLQYIGTNVIREYNPNWHVDRLREMIKPNTDYVFEDTRFPNEKKMLEELDIDCWYIVRPTIDNISNHISETSLKWQDFGNNVIINDKCLNWLDFSWSNFVSMYEKSKKVRDKVIKQIINGECHFSEEQLSTYDSLLISKKFFDYKPIEFKRDDIVNAEEKNNIVTIKNIDGSFTVIDNPLNIEDLKAFL